MRQRGDVALALDAQFIERHGKGERRVAMISSTSTGSALAAGADQPAERA